MRLPDINTTIVALATPPGAAALAVIRLTGPQAFSTAAAFTSPPQRAPAHKLVKMLDIMDGRRPVDRGVAVFFKGPASYTGQDTVELTCHGSPYVVRRTLALAVAAGAAPAGPGEFTLRAFVNGKLDLAQAEAVNGLIASSTAAAHRAAEAQVRGEMSRRVSALKRRALALLAELEVRLDDSYEETAGLDAQAFAAAAAALEKEISALAGGFEAGRGIREGLRVVIAGAPNSGKSSLLNALLGYDRAIVSPSAGTTRDTLEAELELHGFKVVFTDTAGLDARRRGPLERQGMERAARAVAQADIVILLKDCSGPETASDKLAAGRTAKLFKGAKLIKVLSKSDLSGRARKGWLRVSCRSGEGLPVLSRAIVEGQTRLLAEGAEAPVIFARHYAALSGAAGELRQLGKLLRGKAPRLELAAERLRGALGALGSILGEAAPEELLAEIFGSFCVGK